MLSVLILLPLLMSAPPGSTGREPATTSPAFTAAGIEVQDAGIELTGDQVELLKRVLESLPARHLRGLKTVVIHAAVSQPLEPRLDLEGILTVDPSPGKKAEILCLEVISGIALNVYRNVLADEERRAFFQSWERFGGGPAKDAERIFRVYYANYFSGSDSSLLTAAHGEHPENVLPVLFVASQFADPDSGRIRMSLLMSGTVGVDSPKVSRTDEILRIARFSFYLQDGAVVVGSSAVSDGGRPRVERTRWAAPVSIPEAVLSRFKQTE